MANSVEIVSVGARVRVAIEATAGVRPTYGYTDIPDINSAPEQDMSTETIDVSNISDYVTRYMDGRQDPGGDQNFTLNHTDRVINTWDALAAEVGTALASGKRCWFEYWFPAAKKSYFWAGKPKALGTSGIAQNELDTIPAHVVLNDWEGWAAKSGIAADCRYVNVTTSGAGNTFVVKVYDYPSGSTITPTSATPAVATAAAGTEATDRNGLTYTPITVTGASTGSTTVSVSDGVNTVVFAVTVTA